MKLFSTLYVVLCFALCCSVLQCMSVKWYALCLSAFRRVDLMRLSSGPLNTTTHCNTLQHTATHCNTLQHTARHCLALLHTAAQCNTMQRNDEKDCSLALRIEFEYVSNKSNLFECVAACYNVLQSRCNVSQPDRMRFLGSSNIIYKSLRVCVQMSLGLNVWPHTFGNKI